MFLCLVSFCILGVDLQSCGLFKYSRNANQNNDISMDLEKYFDKDFSCMSLIIICQNKINIWVYVMNRNMP